MVKGQLLSDNLIASEGERNKLQLLKEEKQRVQIDNTATSARSLINQNKAEVIPK